MCNSLGINFPGLASIACVTFEERRKALKQSDNANRVVTEAIAKRLWVNIKTGISFVGHSSIGDDNVKRSDFRILPQMRRGFRRVRVDKV